MLCFNTKNLSQFGHQVCSAAAQFELCTHCCRHGGSAGCGAAAATQSGGAVHHRARDGCRWSLCDGGCADWHSSCVADLRWAAPLSSALWQPPSRPGAQVCSGEAPDVVSGLAHAYWTGTCALRLDMSGHCGPSLTEGIAWHGSFAGGLLMMGAIIHVTPGFPGDWTNFLS